MNHGRRHGREGEGRDQDACAGFQAQRLDRQEQRGRAGGNGQCIFRPHEIGEFLLQQCHGRCVGRGIAEQVARLQHALDLGPRGGGDRFCVVDVGSKRHVSPFRKVSFGIRVKHFGRNSQSKPICAADAQVFAGAGWAGDATDAGVICGYFDPIRSGARDRSSESDGRDWPFAAIRRATTQAGRLAHLPYIRQRPALQIPVRSPKHPACRALRRTSSPASSAGCAGHRRRRAGGRGGHGP